MSDRGISPRCETGVRDDSKRRQPRIEIERRYRQDVLRIGATKEPVTLGCPQVTCQPKVSITARRILNLIHHGAPLRAGVENSIQSSAAVSTVAWQLLKHFVQRIGLNVENEILSKTQDSIKGRQKVQFLRTAFGRDTRPDAQPQCAFSSFSRRLRGCKDGATWPEEDKDSEQTAGIFWHENVIVRHPSRHRRALGRSGIRPDGCWLCLFRETLPTD